MRPKFKSRQELDFTQASLKVTREYYAKYEGISQILNENPEIVEAVREQAWTERSLRVTWRGVGGRDCEFSSDTVLRIVIVKQVEGMGCCGTLACRAAASRKD